METVRHPFRSRLVRPTAPFAGSSLRGRITTCWSPEPSCSPLSELFYPGSVALSRTQEAEEEAGGQERRRRSRRRRRSQTCCEKKTRLLLFKNTPEARLTLNREEEEEEEVEEEEKKKPGESERNAGCKMQLAAVLCGALVTLLLDHTPGKKMSVSPAGDRSSKWGILLPACSAGVWL